MGTIRSILIVDDNEADRFIAKRILERSGRFEHVFAVENGVAVVEMFSKYDEEAAAHPERFPPLIMLLDVNMPRMSGFETLEALIAMDLPSMPSVVVMLTSSSDEKDQVRACDFDIVQDFVTKPLTQARAIALAERFGS